MFRERLPLAGYELARSGDLDHVREVIGRVLRPHRVSRLGNSPLDAWVRFARLRDMSVSVISYGGDVRFESDPLETFFAVLMPLSGVAMISHGRQRMRALPGQACVLSPTDPVDIRWSGDCTQLIARFERAALEARLSDLLGAPLGRPLRFEPPMDVSSGYGRSWRCGLELLVSEWDRPGTLIEQPLVAHRFERTLMSALLVAHTNNYTSMINGETHAAPSRAVGIALEWIESHPKWRHTTASLAREADVTERALQRGFRKYLNMRPMEYLREVRLRRIHDELQAAQADAVTVTGIAADWGFLHAGHFAAKYQQRFGEKPSETLRR
ncbi:AraC family transcriptional regulator [Actinocrispum sp. NPDC049592]|uniref:AraC family transcriptional regulator n=1 Tax=Actinocrispum sp. NPDC049592 TaxID=3154835 RepID=UPI0034364C78